MESILIAKYKEFEKQLRDLNFSAYESAVYFSLLGKNNAVPVTEITETCGTLGREVPLSKIYSVLNSLEQKGLVDKIDKPLRYSIKFGKDHLSRYIQQQANEKEEELERQKNERLKRLDTIWKETLSQLRSKDDIWRIYSKDEATEISLSICKNATQELRIMTEHGGWLYEDQEFRNVLEEKSKNKKMKIWALIADEILVKPNRKQEWIKFKKFLEDNEIRYYSYEPRALRMTVADKKESLFFMYKDSEQKEEPIIYYTALPDVSYSLAAFFNMECLFEYNHKLKSFIKSNKKDAKFCELQNLLFG